VQADGDGFAPLQIGELEQGSSLVLELVQPAVSSATFQLQTSDGDEVVPTSAEGDLAEYRIPETGDFQVAVSGEPGPTTPGVNVRRNSTLVPMPDVLGTDSTAAEQALTQGGLLVTGTRQVCSDLPDLVPGQTIRVIDVDRDQYVSEADSELVDVETPPTGSVTVATGTTVRIEAWTGAACSETASTVGN
jgi:hypothetical protein